MRISIVIPNCNGEDLLKKNLPKVFEALKVYEKKAGDDTEVIIVDDKSTDGSVVFLQSQHAKLFVNNKNLGFSSTVNRGVREAKGEIVVLLNTDVVPEKDFLEPLIKHFKDPNVFAVGCMDKSIEQERVILRGRGVGFWQRGFLVHARGEVDNTNTLWASGGSGAFRKSIWEKLGGFNQLYNPFYWEDIDLSYRAIKCGYTILFESKSIVLHEHEEGVIKKTYSPFQIKTMAYRNQFMFVWLNATDLDLQFLHLLWLPYHFVKALLRFDIAFFLGFVAAFIRLPKIIQSSLSAQKNFVKSDREVVQNFTT